MRNLRTICAGALAAALFGCTAWAAAGGALELARQARKKGDEQLASLYYLNAVANDRRSLDALKEYAAMVEGQTEKAGDPESVEALYRSLLALTEQQAALVEPDLIPHLNALISELDVRRKAALKRLDDVPDETGPTADVALENLKIAFAAFIRDEGESAELLNDLNDAVAAARAFPKEEKKLRQMADIAAEAAQKTLDRRAFAASLAQLRELLARLEREADPEHFAIVDATITNGLAGLVLQKDKAAPEQLAELKAAETKRKEIVRHFVDENSRKMAETLERAAGRIEVESGTNTQKIERFVTHIRAIEKNAQAGSLTMEDALRQKEAIQKIVASLAEQRVKAYNRWALTQVEMALSGDSNSLSNDDRRRILTEYYGPIDPRFLEPNVQRAYAEVFAFFYQSLTVADKLSVDKSLATATKKKMEDF